MFNSFILYDIILNGSESIFYMIPHAQRIYAHDLLLMAQYLATNEKIDGQKNETSGYDKIKEDFLWVTF